MGGYFVSRTIFFSVCVISETARFTSFLINLFLENTQKMLYDSRFTFLFPRLVGKTLEGMGELYFTTIKKKKKKKTPQECSRIFKICHKQLG